MDWILFKGIDTPREEKTGIEWLDKVLETAAEITAREIHNIVKDIYKDRKLSESGLMRLS